MKVGDLIKSKTRYLGCVFLVVAIRDAGAYDYKQVMSVRIPDGLKTRWSNIETWEVISGA